MRPYRFSRLFFKLVITEYDRFNMDKSCTKEIKDVYLQRSLMQFSSCHFLRQRGDYGRKSCFPEVRAERRYAMIYGL